MILQANTDTFTDSTGADSQSVFLTDFMLNPNWVSFSNQFSLYCFNNTVNQILSSASPVVYPNPSTGNFRIEIGNYGEHSIDIFNSIGQKVIYTSFGEDFVNVDMSNYLPGIYYFKVDNSKSGKIILTGK
ncbi:MAG: T9SS type A sorting domain-containing protein [Bacteroidetes bacterium]|nr:T9SS type A sorting domain-containing protein [Bacteroidota bacterium]